MRVITGKLGYKH